MFSTMYERRMKAAFWASMAVFGIAVALLLFDSPDSAEDWMNVSMIAFTAVALLAVAGSSRQKYHEVKEFPIPESEVHIGELDHLIIKRDPGFFPRLLLFAKTGQFAGEVKPQKVPIIFYPLSFLFKDSAVMLLPITYGLHQSDGELLFTLRWKGLKRSIVSVQSSDGEHLGEYIQEDFKSLSKIKGVVKGTNDRELFTTEVKGFSGDFSLSDAEGRRWARFDNGFFPHELTGLFRDMDNDIVYFNEELPADQKQLLLAVVAYLFLERRN